MHIAFIAVKHIKMGGGIEKYTLELGSRLVQRGHQVTVFSMRHYDKVERECNGMRVVGVPGIRCGALEKLSTSAVAALHAAVGKRPDIIHYHAAAAGSLAQITRWRRIPSVLQMHGIEWQRSRWNALGAKVLRYMERTAPRYADAVTAVSKLQCDFLRQEYGIHACHIPTGAEIKPHTSPECLFRLGIEPKAYFLFASRLVREKGAHYLVEAFRRIPTDFRLVVAGDSNDKRYIQELKAMAAGDSRIVFPGYVRGKLLDELFSNAFAYVHPSELEGLSIALLEAMSYGNICLVSDIPENQEAVGDCGVYFENKNVLDLERKLAELIAVPERLDDLGQRAIARVRNDFSWDSIADRFETLYRAVLHGDPLPTAPPFHAERPHYRSAGSR